VADLALACRSDQFVINSDPIASAVLLCEGLDSKPICADVAGYQFLGVPQGVSGDPLCAEASREMSLPNLVGACSVLQGIRRTHGQKGCGGSGGGGGQERYQMLRMTHRPGTAVRWEAWSPPPDAGSSGWASGLAPA